ncbi:MAG TPA: OmpA family protein [Gemmatimonadaceae bacterium]|nr:OmpA family protein [Gemmatimonadaceae bacterium]
MRHRLVRALSPPSATWRFAAAIAVAAVLFAACDVHSPTTPLTVIPGALASITVTPNPVSLAINSGQQYTAVGKDAAGNIVAITPTWSIVAAGGAINSTAMFTAGSVQGSFPNTVQASSGSISGNATVSQPGTEAYNMALGLKRAEAAKAYIVWLGVDAVRIEIATRGEGQLAVEGPGEIANAANRRGQFRVLIADPYLVKPKN